MPTITHLAAREVLDSRGNPTVEVEVFGSEGARGWAIVPSGASTGSHEAVELRDGDPERYNGKGVRTAVRNVLTEIAPELVGKDLEDQSGIDGLLITLDGTPNKARLGANAVLGVSLAVSRAAADARDEELYVYLNRLWRERLGEAAGAEPTLPLPMVNMISGGLHAGGNLDFQDVLLVPVGASTYRRALEMSVGVYRCLGSVLRDYHEEYRLVGDEGGYGPRLRTNAQAVDRVLEAVMARKMTIGVDAAIALDVASTHFFDPADGRYKLDRPDGGDFTTDGMIGMLEHWVRQYPIVSIEDGLAEDDWEGWSTLTERLGDRVQLIGDDLFATQASRLREGITRRAGNAVLVKPNQVGTLSETLDVLLLARRNNYRAVVSARSGETEDPYIADLAVATAAGQIKIGSIVRSERLAKYNRLLRIEEQLGAGTAYVGLSELRMT